MANVLQQIKNNTPLTPSQILEITLNTPLEELLSMANEIRQHFLKNDFDSCSIMNARSGMCSENCKWCSQSKFHNSDVEIYPLVNDSQAIEHATDNHCKGIRRFSLVTSGRTLCDAEVDKAYRLYQAIGARCTIKLCASMGLLNHEQLQKLYDAGVRRYHCNIETAPSFFPELCTTHTTQEKVATIKTAQKVGMEICSGGIIGMGETMAQRVEMAFFLRDLGVNSVPINVLNPIKGTALESQPALSDQELLRSFAMFRLVLPDIHIRFAGGRTLFNHLVKKALQGGVSGAIMGDMLTTIGASVAEDKKMIAELGLEM